MASRGSPERRGRRRSAGRLEPRSTSWISPRERRARPRRAPAPEPGVARVSEHQPGHLGHRRRDGGHSQRAPLLDWPETTRPRRHAIGESAGRPHGAGGGDRLPVHRRPVLQAELYLTIPNLERARGRGGGRHHHLAARRTCRRGPGIFRSAFGRQNGQHLHVQEFTRRPLVNEAYLGIDGLRAPGAQVSWLVPVPFFLQLSRRGVRRRGAGGLPAPLHLRRHARVVRRNVCRGPEPHRHRGAQGVLPRHRVAQRLGGAQRGARDLARSRLRAGPLGALSRRRPALPFDARGLRSLREVQAAQRRRRLLLAGLDHRGLRAPARRGPDAPLGGTPGPDGGLYTQLVAQVARRWLVGVREDLLGATLDRVPAPHPAHLAQRHLPLQRVRPPARVRRAGDHRAAGPGLLLRSAGLAAYLQLEVSMGAHGAHAF